MLSLPRRGSGDVVSQKHNWDGFPGSSAWQQKEGKTQGGLAGKGKYSVHAPWESGTLWFSRKDGIGPKIEIRNGEKEI